MLSDDTLVIEVRRLAELDQKLPTLLVLAQVEQPTKPAAIYEKAEKIGFRQMRDWNVGSILHRASRNALVTQSPEGWRMLEPGAEELRKAGIDLERKAAIPASDSVLPRDIFRDTRPYIERVVAQINASYDCGLYDCCAVMCRRLLETSLIEVYEAAGRASEIKGADGHFLMLAPLLSRFESDRSFHASRNAMKGLKDFKQLGDLSAHNRRFNAHQNDIDRIRDGLRVAVGELLVMAHLKSDA